MVPDWAVGVVVVMGALFVMLALVVALGLWVVRRQDRAKGDPGVDQSFGIDAGGSDLEQLKWLGERGPGGGSR